MIFFFSIVEQSLAKIRFSFFLHSNVDSLVVEEEAAEAVLWHVMRHFRNGGQQRYEQQNYPQNTQEA